MQLLSCTLTLFGNYKGYNRRPLPRACSRSLFFQCEFTNSRISCSHHNFLHILMSCHSVFCPSVCDFLPSLSAAY
uniref:Uncharacterized protein n=1 Tax=Anguilla anguilla TaxID=7936 RepID=A0A0E9WX61_ANGAN